MCARERIEHPTLRIVVETGGEIVSDSLFRQALISIGRFPENDVVIDDNHVSAKHLVIRTESPRGFRVFDQSSNGTFWEGERIATLKFDRETILDLADYHVTLIPVIHDGTEEMNVPGVDLFARTVVEERMPLMDDAGQETAAHTGWRPSSGDALPEAELRAISQGGELHVHVFRGSALIGRAPECDLRFVAPDISRQHAIITAGPSGYTLRRLSKKNPVQVNEQDVGGDEAVMLRDGDVIRISDEEVVFLCPATHPAGKGSTLPGEASPNFDLAVNRRGCFNPQVSAVDVIGFLGTKTVHKFEEQLLREIAVSRKLLVDLGYLVGIDREGIAALGRAIAEAEKAGVRIQFIRVTPRIADLLSYSELKQLLTNYISRTEETAVRRLTV